jgi:hypothetical protein
MAGMPDWLPALPVMIVLAVVSGFGPAGIGMVGSQDLIASDQSNG